MLPTSPSPLLLTVIAILLLFLIPTCRSVSYAHFNLNTCLSYGPEMHHDSCYGPFKSNLPRSKLSGNRNPSFLYLSAPTKAVL